MAFWVYENWRAHGRQSRVHTATCQYCRDGAGASGGTRADNGLWHGPFATFTGALAHAKALPGTTNVCRVCSPDDSGASQARVSAS